MTRQSETLIDVVLLSSAKPRKAGISPFCVKNMVRKGQHDIKYGKNYRMWLKIVLLMILRTNVLVWWWVVDPSYNGF